MHGAMANRLTPETSAQPRQPAVRIAPFGTVSVQIVMAGGPARAETEPRASITRLPETTLQTVILQVPVPRSFT